MRGVLNELCRKLCRVVLSFQWSQKRSQWCPKRCENDNNGGGSVNDNGSSDGCDRANRGEENGRCVVGGIKAKLVFWSLLLLLVAVVGLDIWYFRCFPADFRKSGGEYGRNSQGLIAS